ncbi:helix-turn-helix domain-containing protein [Hydrogenophaga sp.]|uniref:IclR family transcriptional regulator n=1 Tax=Hydrogenophaga sp. TaxID=1904254 RepID=UPI00262AB69A|nr:helix-turn-helix domain-containing protein [Hydrogenophaga sp.]MCW5653029.1 helix-turn-helix domain-containing protein [Hydrogenophaga sp.]
MATSRKTSSARPRTDSSTDRVLSLLELFTEDAPVWTVEELMALRSMARATLYRYLRALVETGFLSPSGDGSYSLGPRVIEMDRQIRLSDPLLQVAKPIMAAQRDAFGGAQLLCRYYGERVVSIHDDHTDERIKTSFDRGRPFGLFLGAPSRVILAHLGPQQLQRIYLHHAQDILAAGLGGNWIEFRDHMREVRQQGYVVASDIDKKLVGIAAPIFVTPSTVIGSICLVRIKKETDAAQVEHLGNLATEMGRKISASLQRARPPART